LYSTSDTIVAIATPPGRGGIGVVRLSGPDAESIAGRLITHGGALEHRRATLTRVRRSLDAICDTCETIDQVVVTFFPSPASYTGEDVVELSAHGSPVVLRAIVELAMSIGARLAEPGEFTLRAFLNGRIDLMQAEAVGDLIDAATPLQARAAFDQLEGTLTRTIADIDSSLFDLIARLEASVDFPDEGFHFVEPGALVAEIDRLRSRTAALLADAGRGRVVREGLQIAIVGGPNVGKSSLFNALVGASRAIVADIPGTTRDLVTEVIDLEGLRVTLVDTAGLRETTDFVEAEGVARSRQAIDVADLVLVVVDVNDCETIDNKHVIVQNKIDLGRSGRGVGVSATTGAGLDELRRAILAALDVDLHRDRPAITNVRHISLVKRAHEAMGRARDAAVASGGSMSEEFLLADLQEARAGLEEITGRRAPGELLEHIFSRFCIGK
jgi:tRNA modification GTPase